MRTLLLAAAAAVLWSASAAAQAPGGTGFTRSDFELRTAQDLLDVCTLATANPDHPAAKAFCFGFVSGGQHFHDEISVVEGIKPIACPDGRKTREEIVAVFVEHLRKKPGTASERPMNAVFEAVAERWPCPRSAAK